MCFRLYLVVGQIHYLPIHHYTEHLFTCQELFRKRKDGVGFHRHHKQYLFILLVKNTSKKMVFEKAIISTTSTIVLNQKNQ